MTIPNVPPDPEMPDAPGRREPSPDLPSPDLPPDGPDPEIPPSEAPPEFPSIDEPSWVPGTPEDYDAPMRLPGENPDVETEL